MRLKILPALFLALEAAKMPDDSDPLMLHTNEGIEFQSGPGKDCVYASDQDHVAFQTSGGAGIDFGPADCYRGCLAQRPEEGPLAFKFGLTKNSKDEIICLCSFQVEAPRPVAPAFPYPFPLIGDMVASKWVYRGFRK